MTVCALWDAHSRTKFGCPHPTCIVVSMTHSSTCPPASSTCPSKRHSRRLQTSVCRASSLRPRDCAPFRLGMHARHTHDQLVDGDVAIAAPDAEHPAHECNVGTEDEVQEHNAPQQSLYPHLDDHGNASHAMRVVDGVAIIILVLLPYVAEIGRCHATDQFAENSDEHSEQNTETEMRNMRSRWRPLSFMSWWRKTVG